VAPVAALPSAKPELQAIAPEIVIARIQNRFMISCYLVAETERCNRQIVH
jgi:hypothetical protein